MAATHTVLFTVMPARHQPQRRHPARVGPRVAAPHGRGPAGRVPGLAAIGRHAEGRAHVHVPQRRADSQGERSTPARSSRSCGARSSTRDTFVRSRAFDDYSQHGIVSYSVRESLSALKAVYQEAGGRAGAARRSEASAEPGRETRQPSAARRDPRRPRRALERESRRSAGASSCAACTGPAAPSGRWPARSTPRVSSRRRATPGAFQSVAVPFAVYHHMPTPTQRGRRPGCDRSRTRSTSTRRSARSNRIPSCCARSGWCSTWICRVDLVPQTVFPAFSTIVGGVHERSAGRMPPTLAPARDGLRPLDGRQHPHLLHGVAHARRPPSAPAQILGLLNLDPETLRHRAGGRRWRDAQGDDGRGAGTTGRIRAQSLQLVARGRRRTRRSSIRTRRCRRCARAAFSSTSIGAVRRCSTRSSSRRPSTTRSSRAARSRGRSSPRIWCAATAWTSGTRASNDVALAAPAVRQVRDRRSRAAVRNQGRGRLLPAGHDPAGPGRGARGQGPLRSRGDRALGRAGA